LVVYQKLRQGWVRERREGGKNRKKHGEGEITKIRNNKPNGWGEKNARREEVHLYVLKGRR